MTFHYSVKRRSSKVVRLIAESCEVRHTWERKWDSWRLRRSEGSGKTIGPYEIVNKEHIEVLDQKVEELEGRKSSGRDKLPRPTIVLKPGRLPAATDSAESALLFHGEQFKVFQRGGELVRIFSLPERFEGEGLRRPKGIVQLEPVSSTALTEVFNRIAKWQDKGAKGNRVADCPPKIAINYLSRRTWRLPVLDGIISAPILRNDGTVLDSAGYDAATRLYLVSRDSSYDVPERPTHTDAQAALRKLSAPFSEFPFVTEEDRSVHIACILTAIQRPLLMACPLFGYSAPAQRSGKSLLAESVAIIATGTPAAATAISGDREEMRKMITSVLREGHSIVNLDNVEHPLASADLAKAITQSEYQDRALGTNRMLRLPTGVLWTATGNNLSFRKDLSSRALLCRIDAQVEAPEARTFKISQLGDYLRTHREDLITAGLTILRAYHLAQRPRQNVSPWGGFEDWSARIREPLVWLGVADPCNTRSGVLAEDPEREASLTVLHTLYDKFKSDEFTTKKIIRRCESSSTLRTALEAVAIGRHNEIDSIRIGWWFRRTHNQIIGGFRLESVGKESGSSRWRITEVSRGQGGHGGHFPARSGKRFPGLGNTAAHDGTIKRYPRLKQHK